MESAIRNELKPGTPVRVVQQIAARNYTWTSDIRGVVVEYRQQQTGSWFAHSKDDKLWLDRLTLRKIDGELITLNLDGFSHVEVDQTAAAAGAAPVAGDGEKKNATDLPV
ncbi:MAG TPA: hypothetical protein VLI90_09005 [Tepidisphaeraceae bacterium]|nr:hypothetical protein [Tepidisphaeraceae bacterium]